MRTITYRRLLVAGLAALAMAGCGTAATATSPPPVEPATPVADHEHPANDVELATGTTHRFPDLLPGALGVEIALTEPMVFPYSGPEFVFLGDAEGNDVVTFMDADSSQLLADPTVLPPIDEIDDPAALFVEVPPGELLARLAGLPSLEVTASERPVTIADTPGTAIDVRVPDFPAGAEPCAEDLPPCLGLVVVPENLYYVVAGQELRIAVLEHPAGRVLVLQSLQDPRGQAVLDTTRFTG